MTTVINYNPMLMMLYNLEPNILVLTQANNWDENENQLVQEALKLHQQSPELNIAVMNLETLATMETGTYSLNTIVKQLKTESLVDYFINYWIELTNNNQKEIFLNIKSLLNVQKIVVNNNFKIGNELLNTKILTKIFGKENVVFMSYLEPSEKLQEVKNILTAGKVQDYFKTTNTPYRIRGQVVEGKQLGRILGFPTANLKVNPQILLKQGVYYVKVKLPNMDHLYDGMSCYWVNEQNDYVIETYLFDFHQNIYGWFIELQFLEYIRDNIPVHSQEELKALLQKDAHWVQKKRKKRK